MLSAVLHSDIAIQVSINIMAALVEMRKFFANNSLLFEKVSEVSWRQAEYERRTDDRVLILDDDRAYHIGASLKDAGKKCFAISLMKDVAIIQDILQRLNLEAEEKEG